MRKTAILFVILLITFLFPRGIRASTTYFQDNFDDNDVSDWTVPRNPCRFNGSPADWTVEGGKYGIKINGGSCVTETIPVSISISTGVEYSFEVDMTMTQSTEMDRNFVFKYQDAQNWYGIHTFGNNIYMQKVIGGVQLFPENWASTYAFQNDQTYRFKIELFNNKIKIFVDNNLVTTIPEASPSFQNSKVGLQASAGGVPNSEVWFDNVMVRSLDPEPTPTPTPLPSLAVEDIKQYSSPWNDDVYDLASSWSSNPSIERWGCALTSAAMVLKYHGHTGANPDVLNNWLKSQPDGYIRNGLLNWLAVSRYTRINDSASSPTLEYRRLGTGQSDLTAELTAGRPAILGEPGHFVVGKSQTADSFGINDPAYANRTLLSDYSNTYQSLGSYRPTHTNLSYLLLVADGDTNLSISDPAATSFLENPLTDDVGGSAQSGEAVRVLLLPQPGDGDYTVTASGAAGLYTLETYFYDQNGEVTLATQAGILATGEEDNLQLTVGDEPQSLPIVTIDSTINDWKTAYDQGLISKKSVYKSVRNLLRAAKKLWPFNQPKAAKKLLKVSHQIVKKSKHIDAQVRSVIQQDIEILLKD